MKIDYTQDEEKRGLDYQKRCDYPHSPTASAQIFRSLIKNFQRVPVTEYNNTVPDNVKVSVCVPTYQHVPTIKKCIGSILEQDISFSYEILIGEDCSTDGTRELCLEYAKKYPNIIRLFLHSRENNIKINGQPSGRFNLLYLLHAAKGDYIAICEGDDWWTDKSKLLQQVKSMMENQGCDISCHPAKTGSNQYVELGGVIGNRGNKQHVIGVDDVILGDGGFCATLTLIFHRNVLVRLPEWLIFAPVLDYFLMVIASLRGGCLYIPTLMGVYGNDGSDNISWTSRLMSNQEFAVDVEVSFFSYLNKLSYEVDSQHKGTVVSFMKKKKISSLFAWYLPRWFRVSVYKHIKSSLGWKSRLTWYLSMLGVFPNFPKRMVKMIRKYLPMRS
ncbi:MAG: glycosyltransferase family 2 protein [Planctomycetes bacterium]|nr:glycosyltransferase family 2 protein [Planctomycetota bacterium]